MVYCCKSVVYISQAAKAITLVFHTELCIWMTSSSIHICIWNMYTCRQNKHTETPSGGWKFYLKLWELGQMAVYLLLLFSLLTIKVYLSLPGEELSVIVVSFVIIPLKTASYMFCVTVPVLWYWGMACYM